MAAISEMFLVVCSHNTGAALLTLAVPEVMFTAGSPASVNQLTGQQQRRLDACCQWQCNTYAYGYNVCE